MTNKKEKLNPDFIQIPYQLISDKTLAPIDRLVYGAVYFYSKMRGERCYAGNSEIARLLLSTPNTIGNALRKLEDRGYIIRGFSDPGTKVNRTEIIPTVAMGRMARSKYPSFGGVQVLKDTPSNDGRGQSGDGVKSIIPVSTQNGGILESEDEKVASNKDILSDTPSFGSTSPDGESIEEIEKIIENNEKEQRIDPSGQDDFGVGVSLANMVEKPEDPINKAIALFLPYFPGDFSGKSSAFAKPPTRAAVKELLKRYDHAQIADLLRRWNDKRTEKFRPEAGTVYEFCTYKLAKIEAFLEKEGGLWAQRSISTPEQAKVRKDQYQEVIEEARERDRKAKEDWLREHPEENIE